MNPRTLFQLAAALSLSSLLSAQTPPPTLHFASPQQQAALGEPYTAALANLLQTNTVPYPTDPKSAYNQTGLLAADPGTFFRAGAGYAQPWTRDASINSWSAGSLLAPAVARNTLWSVVRRQPNGQLIVQQDNQWWDQVIWITAAWNHYLVTGDRAFLTEAYQAAQNTLAEDKRLHFNAQRGLFQGAAFLNDGIAGYPAPPADPTESRGSFVLDYPGSAELMPLSTNCLYVSAYRTAALMAAELHRPTPEAAAFTAAATALTGRIRTALWLPAKGRFAYFLKPDGTLDDSQESSGLAFALLFDIATPAQAQDILKSAHTEPHGIPDISPAFPRFSTEHPGRHNNIVWPPIQAFWAQAAARAGSIPAFQAQVEDLAALAHADNHFWEIYNGTTGKPDGGWQVGHNWTSEQDQTWSATGYLRMIYLGLFGLRFQPTGLALQPTLPATWANVTLSGLHYRNAVLAIDLHGSGNKIQTFTLDGKPQPQPTLPATLQGPHTVDITLTTP